MQLVAYGAQDVYLTGNPQITFFKVVYRRHTNFSMESITQTLTGQHTLGQRLTATISRNGDLIHSMYLQMTFKNENANTMENLGHGAIESVAVEIGGQQIDKQYGEWMDIWSDLTIPYSKRHGYKEMSHGKRSDKNRTIKVPLQFWFCRNAGLALPLIALQYHEVKVIVTTRSDIGGATSSGAELSNAELWVDYIYLDTDERRRFAQVSHEYLIEQLQFTGNLTSDATNQHTLNFNHPVKELVWVERADSTPENWNNWQIKEDDIDIKIVLNGHDRMSGRNPSYYTHWQTHQHHTNIPMCFPPLAKGGLAAIEGELAGAAAVHDDKITVTAAVFATGWVAEIENNDGTKSDHLVTKVNAAGTELTLEPLVKKAADATKKVNFYRKLHGQACSRNIHVYSFALKPEEHQPSGTCNFSRIDNATLNRKGNGGELLVYAVNYNVLRIMSGMGGLAYSN